MFNGIIGWAHIEANFIYFSPPPSRHRPLSVQLTTDIILCRLLVLLLQIIRLFVCLPQVYKFGNFLYQQEDK